LHIQTHAHAHTYDPWLMMVIFTVLHLYDGAKVICFQKKQLWFFLFWGTCARTPGDTHARNAPYN
jgi:hypothetical protein